MPSFNPVKYFRYFNMSSKITLINPGELSSNKAQLFISWDLGSALDI
jgi:hypothetical protein